MEWENGKNKAIATIPGYSFKGKGTGITPEIAGQQALDQIDKQIDNAYGLSHGLRSYYEGRKLKDSTEVNPQN